ncbi:hypothetical protein HYV89_04815 [Candidatus Woesearchaeota archaeon]|nr:hypothetical protein [Candidatus Woesearchaeota archaeon]
MEENYCFLTREEVRNGIYINYDALFVVQAGNKCGENPWMRRVRSYAEEIGGHYVVVREDELKTNTETTSNFSILGVEHEKIVAEGLCLDECRKLAAKIADPLGCGVKDFTIEKTVQS